jgi:hypothetical protein
MWLDVRAKLAEIQASPPATTATTATTVTKWAEPVPRVAEVAEVAGPLPLKPKKTFAPQPNDGDAQDMWRHGASVTGSPRTWTGRIVSLDAWRTLTEWEKHGPNGRHWCGLCRGWHYPTECKGGAT